MVTNKSHHDQADPEVIRQVLDEALGQVKATSFSVLYTIGKLVEKYGQNPITTVTISKVSGVCERTIRSALRELSKTLLLDVTETPHGHVFRFIPPERAASFSVVEGAASFSGDMYISLDLSTHDEDQDETSPDVEEEDPKKYYTPGNHNDHRDPRALREVPRAPRHTHRSRGIFNPKLVETMSELADTFEGFVISNSKQRITPVRRAKWYRGLHFLVATRNVTTAEFEDVVGFLFGNWHGYLPFPVKFDDRKITRVSQISRNWDQILTTMEASR